MTRIIPPILFLLLLVPLVLLWQYHPKDLIMRADKPMPWDIPLILGLGLLVWARVYFAKNSAEINTFKTPHSLLEAGPYRFSRNPMYLGFLLLMISAAFYVNTACALLVPLAFFLAAQFYYIPYEEHKLHETFGSKYDDYTQKVRRWL